jgi:S-methylmethionine-dependent homocysteine/selenocysteine methylase
MDRFGDCRDRQFRQYDLLRKAGRIDAGASCIVQLQHLSSEGISRSMNYAEIEQRLKNGGIVILDGGTGTELERRGVPMNAEAWCGPATIEHTDVLESIHRDYVAAGADIITANTFASSRLMLGQAGFADRFEDINTKA